MGTKIFLQFGWRAAAAFSLGLFVWQIGILLLRGPHCERYTWFGYQGGLESRKKVVEERKRQKIREEEGQEQEQERRDEDEKRGSDGADVGVGAGGSASASARTSDEKKDVRGEVDVEDVRDEKNDPSRVV